MKIKALIAELSMLDEIKPDAEVKIADLDRPNEHDDIHTITLGVEGVLIWPTK